MAECYSFSARKRNSDAEMTEAVKNTKRGRELFTDRDLKHLILPFLGEQLLVSLVGIADAFMVSFAGEEAVSGVTLTNMLVTFFLYVFTALASGGAVVVSQYIGKGSREESNDAASQLLMVSGSASWHLQCRGCCLPQHRPHIDHNEDLHSGQHH